MEQRDHAAELLAIYTKEAWCLTDGQTGEEGSTFER